MCTLMGLWPGTFHLHTLQVSGPTEGKHVTRLRGSMCDRGEVNATHFMKYYMVSHPGNMLLYTGTMYSTVVSLNPTASKSMVYYAWDALNAACALELLALRHSSQGDLGDRWSSVSGPMCKIHQDIETVAVLSGPGRGAIRITNHESAQQYDHEERLSVKKKVSFVSDVDPDRFYGFILDMLKT